MERIGNFFFRNATGIPFSRYRNQRNRIPCVFGSHQVCAQIRFRYEGNERIGYVEPEIQVFFFFATYFK